MRYNSEVIHTEGRVIFRVLINRGARRYFGLVFSADWYEWFVGFFVLED